MWSCKRTFSDNSYDLIKSVGLKIEPGIEVDGPGKTAVHIAQLLSGEEGEAISNMLVSELETTQSGMCLSGLAVALSGESVKTVEQRLNSEKWELNYRQPE